MAFYSTAFRNALAGNQTNLLTNPNFNTDTSGWWDRYGAALAIDAGGQNGNCLKVTNTYTNNVDPAFVSQVVANTVAGGIYAFSGHVKRGSANKMPLLRLDPEGGSGYEFVGSADEVTFSSSSEWRSFYRAVRSVWGGNLYPMIGVAKGAAGNFCYWDTLSFCRVLPEGLLSVLKGCSINLYAAGALPVDADAAATGTLLATFSALNWIAVGTGEASKDPTQTWATTALASGTAAYGILYEAGDDPANATTTALRVMFPVGTAFNSALVLDTLTFVQDEAASLSAASFNIPIGF